MFLKPKQNIDDSGLLDKGRHVKIINVKINNKVLDVMWFMKVFKF